jgi:hypothetical protein
VGASVMIGAVTSAAAAPVGPPTWDTAVTPPQGADRDHRRGRGGGGAVQGAGAPDDRVDGRQGDRAASSSSRRRNSSVQPARAVGHRSAPRRVRSRRSRRTHSGSARLDRLCTAGQPDVDRARGGSLHRRDLGHRTSQPCGAAPPPAVRRCRAGTARRAPRRARVDRLVGDRGGAAPPDPAPPAPPAADGGADRDPADPGGRVRRRPIADHCRQAREYASWTTSWASAEFSVIANSWPTRRG